MTVADLPQVDPALEEAASVYRAFMEEIKVRLNMVELCIDVPRENSKLADGYMHAEFGFLQLRFICDLIALSALAAHKPYGLSDELLESWHARRALTELAAINKEGFPRPIVVERRAEGIQLTMQKGLSRNGLQRIFDKCGKALHRGKIKHIFEKRAKIYDMDALARWRNSIVTLLDNHIMMVPAHGLVFVTHLEGGPDGSVSVAITQGEGPFVVVDSEAELAPHSAEDSSSSTK